MPFRLGPGPVFVYESLILSRRRHVYAGRALFVLAILVALASAWYQTSGSAAPIGVHSGMLAAIRMLAEVGVRFFLALAGVQLAMVLLVAPMATAGAICQDRARGILAQLAVTDLSDTEIVLGKLGSRLAPIWGVLLCGLPVPALAALLGGIDPLALISLFIVSVAVSLAGCSLALSLSLRATKTHEVIIAVLALWIFWLLAWPAWQGISRITAVPPPPHWFIKLNPVVLVYAPYTSPRYVSGTDVAVFFVACLLASTALLAWTIASVRLNVLEPVVARPFRDLALGKQLRLGRLAAWLPGPSLDGNPVLWREWRHGRPSRLARMIWSGYVLFSLVSVAIGVREVFVSGASQPQSFVPLEVALLVQFILGLLIASSVAPASLAEDRLRGSLDVLLTTPISSRAIVWGKWLGMYRVVLWLAVLPGLSLLIVACLSPPFPSGFQATGRGSAGAMPLTLLDRAAAPTLLVGMMLSYGAAITSTGLALAIWVRRLGRAIGINVVIFVVITIGWPFLFRTFLEDPFNRWLKTTWAIAGPELYAFPAGMLAISPLFAPLSIVGHLTEFHTGSARWQYWLMALGWCALATAFAAAMFWAAVKSFDRCLGRMPATSASQHD